MTLIIRYPRGVLQEILILLIEEYAPGKEYHQVNAILDRMDDEIAQEAEIVDRYERNKKYYRYVCCKWKKDKEEFQEKLLKCDEKIFDLENEIKEVEIENALKYDLVIKWEGSRFEQTESRFKEELSKLQGKIDKAKSGYEKEMRIYNEVETFTNYEIQRLQKSSAEWDERYQRECSQLDEQIKTAKVQIVNTQDQIQSWREIFIRRNIEIQSYLQLRAQKEESRRLEKQKWDSAVRIQAWWRGTMFRNGLGPWRKKKKATKKAKGGKK